jgi:hypothetical protein
VGFLAIGIWLYAIFCSTDSEVKIRQRRGLFAAGARVFGRRGGGETLVDREAEVVVAANETRAYRRARDRLLRRRRRGQGIGGDYNDVAVTMREEQEVDDDGRIGGAQDPMVEVNERHEENLEETMNKDRDPTVAMTRRDRIRAVKRSEREQRRRFEEERRQELQLKKMAEEEAYKEWIHQKKDAVQPERMQAENKLKASQQREERNYNQWKTLSKVVASGMSSSQQEEMIYIYDNPDFIDDFVRYLKDRKVVPINVLGRSFNKMSTKETLKLITKLEEMGQINGIVDAYGNYNYVDPQEVDRIYAHILLSGRVSTADLSNMLRTIYHDTLGPTDK